MAKRRKPHDPASVTTANLERREREQEIARLKAQGADVTIDRGGRVVSARLSNVFNLLLKRESINLSQHDAAYRLAAQWAKWKGLDGGPEPRSEFVCGSGELEEAETGYVAAKRRDEAGNRVADVLSHLEPNVAKLISAFMVATVEEDRCMAWRGIMERHGYEAGEVVVDGKRWDRQVYGVWSALESLRAVYEQPAQRRAA
jgi:hypothetical protein